MQQHLAMHEKLTSRPLPTDMDVVEQILVCESQLVLLGAKRTDNISISQTECELNVNVPLHLGALVQKICFQ